MKLLTRFINPEIAKKVWDESKVERTESTDDALYDLLPEKLKKKYSAEDLDEIMKDPKHYSELDVIERVE